MPIDLKNRETFASRHIGPRDADINAMLAAVGAASLEEFLEKTVPSSIRLRSKLVLPPARTEDELLHEIRALASSNSHHRSLLGMGYYETITPPVILRNILENPGWYTAYTPYQAEIAQGRLEALLNFQTMIIDLTGLPVANASLLDEATAAAESMSMFFAIKGHPHNGVFLVAQDCHPQTIEVLRTRANPLGITLMVTETRACTFTPEVFGLLLQYPTTDGAVVDYAELVAAAHAAGVLVGVATDLLSLALLKPPGEFGADAAIGNSQRFGVPMGFGGPHAAFLATQDAHKRHLAGRIIGVSVDAQNHPALRMALQTREQHIRREKATSNICTAQVLLAVMAGMYAVYHGPVGIRNIALRVHGLTRVLAAGLQRLGHRVQHQDYFDTLRIIPAGSTAASVFQAAGKKYNLRDFRDGSIGIALDEATTPAEVEELLGFFARDPEAVHVADLAKGLDAGYHGSMQRVSPYLQHPVFSAYHSETEMLRYMHRLASRDLALDVSMIPLGSCTMKLNATAEMLPLTWPGIGGIHPFAPAAQAPGYHRIIGQLADWLKEITGFVAVSMQPNAGAQGEYAGLLVIRAYHEDHGASHRQVCLIPSSAHGTNPASAVMAGMEVVIVACDAQGNIDVADLKEKAVAHKDRLAAFMVTYPSTHGVFEESIKEICRIIHDNGGLVYMDGANMNAQVGLCRPADIGADVCHLNLHKTFAIPHGGGGPGMGPIATNALLAPYLPGHPVVTTGGAKAIGPVSAAPYGSASILTISWAYIAMMGAEGLRMASALAMLNANYMAGRLQKSFPILYRGKQGYVAHEFIVDLRQLKETSGVEAEDVAKRLMDYGFHAPTVSFPVAGTLMIEPTESESREELDRFCDALMSIREEIREIETGAADRQNNVLKHAPHTAALVTADSWKMPYSREKAAFPAPWTRTQKFWPSVARVNNAYGDRNLVCACPPVGD